MTSAMLNTSEQILECHLQIGRVFCRYLAQCPDAFYDILNGPRLRACITEVHIRESGVCSAW